MWGRFSLLVSTGFLAVSSNLASAAPPANCAQKFIGTWVYAGGSTVIAPGGVAYPKCPMCTPTQTWTCQGNTYLFSNSGPPGQFSATLSPDGRRLIGGGVVATRVGGAGGTGGNTQGKTASNTKDPVADKKEPRSQEKSAAPANPPERTSKKSVSCSDITGTSSTAPATSHCRDANQALTAARKVRQNDPKIAAAEFKKAAAAARRASDNALELSILREAMEAAAVIANAVPTAPSAEVLTAPASGNVPRMWDGTRETCGTANKLEKNTASWFVMCTDPPAPQPITHRPSPVPQELARAARNVCGSYSRDTQQCFADFKLKIILTKTPGLKEACEKMATDVSPLRRILADRLNVVIDHRERFLECVDNVYLYGNMNGPPSSEGTLRETMRRALAAARPDSSEAQQPTPGVNKPLCWSPGRCCAAGHGLKPTPGAFGAWSCQPLGLTALVPGRPTSSQDAADALEDLEARLNEAAARAVAVALDAFGLAIPESDRETCTNAAFRLVHATLRGGAPDVPEQCRAMASGARAYFTMYVDGHVNNSNSATEDLLSNFSSDLGAPLPGMIGLTPDERDRRMADCMLRSGSAENCN